VESYNLINSEPEVARSLQGELEEWQRAHDSQKAKTRQADFDEVVEARLRALGYMS